MPADAAIAIPEAREILSKFEKNTSQTRDKLKALIEYAAASEDNPNPNMNLACEWIAETACNALKQHRSRDGGSVRSIELYHMIREAGHLLYASESN